MGRKAAISKKIDGLLAFMVVLLTAIFSICAYVFVNFEKLEMMRVVIAVIVAFMLIISLSYALKSYLKQINLLEVLE